MAMFWTVRNAECDTVCAIRTENIKTRATTMPLNSFYFESIRVYKRKVRLVSRLCSNVLLHFSCTKPGGPRHKLLWFPEDLHGHNIHPLNSVHVYYIQQFV